ncbi:MAG: hypothetical protein ACD_79C00678G0002 [uncultured bacterium]|nr:MAG: hypothetical protein ACD_79C00678G0002 [uncultured bacterium]
MYKIKVFEEQNILKLGFIKDFTVKDAKQLLEELKVKINNTQKGFTVFSDMSQLDSMSQEVSSYIVKIMQVCNEKEAAQVVRVIPDPTKEIGFKILSIFHYSDKVKIFTCNDILEARKFLPNIVFTD